MFTGLIEATGKILATERSSLTIARPALFDDVKPGSSIAISGVCLSITKLDDQSMTFDVMPATLQKTTLGSLKKDDAVNLERAMKADGRFEGHIVQGHCDGVGTVTKIEDRETEDGRHRAICILLPDSLKPFVILHGSIAIDGVSLTVATLKDDELSVALIPQTLALTTLGGRKKGDRVNLEADVLGKYVWKNRGKHG